MIEKDIDNFIAKTLQNSRIDFLRIKNSNFRGGMRNYSTNAYEISFPCDKYFSDFIFPFGGKVHMIENGMKYGQTVSHKDRKDCQLMRMVRWSVDGGCAGRIITSIDDAKAYFKSIGITA